MKSNSVGPWNMSYRRASSLYDHLDHCFVVFKHIQQSFLMWRLDVCVNEINITQLIDHSSRLLTFLNRVKWRTNFTFVQRRASPFLRFWFVSPRTVPIRSHKSSAVIPSNLNLASKEMISDSVELCETEVCFLHIQLIGKNVWQQKKKTHNAPPDVVFESSRSPAKSESWNSPSRHCLAVLPTWHIVCIHMYDECGMLIDSGVCHRPWSILQLIVQVCLLTIEYQVVQFVPSISISEQFGSILVTILQQISFLLLWSGGHRCMKLILCRVVEPSCCPTHYIARHISLHDQPCHKTMKKYEDFEGMVVSLLPPAEIRDSNMVLQLSTLSLLISHCRWVQPRYTWSR